jgi:hypothetical protein
VASCVGGSCTHPHAHAVICCPACAADRVYLCRSGSASDTQAMAAYVQHWIAEHQAEKNGPVNVHTAANLAMQLAYNNKNQLQAGLIIAGWDEHTGGSVYAIPLGGTLLKVRWWCRNTGRDPRAYTCMGVAAHWRRVSGRTQTWARQVHWKRAGHQAFLRPGWVWSVVRSMH